MSSISLSFPNSLSFRERLSKLNEEREMIVKHLAHSDSDYGFGGAHRVWVRLSGHNTADKYIETNADVSTDNIWTLAIPLPSTWNGVRPKEIAETYGHPHTVGKDWRHFENALRYAFALKGYMVNCCSLYDDKGIAFIARKMIDVAKRGLPKLDGELLSLVRTSTRLEYPEKYPYNHIAETQDYDTCCAEIDEHFKGSKIADQKAIVEQYPPALRPFVAINLASA